MEHMASRVQNKLILNVDRDGVLHFVAIKSITPLANLPLDTPIGRLTGRLGRFAHRQAVPGRTNEPFDRRNTLQRIYRTPTNSRLAAHHYVMSTDGVGALKRAIGDVQNGRCSAL